MPIYQTPRPYVSGFYDNKVINGQNDRVYSANDMCMPYKAIFSDGVKPSENGILSDDLQVISAGEMQIYVAAGMGMFGGKYFWNKSAFYITLDTAGAADRYDCVIVKSDENDTMRLSNIYIMSLTSPPTVSDLLRKEDPYNRGYKKATNVNEYCLGYVRVPALTSAVSQIDITDTRLNQNLCGVITGVYQQLDGASIAAQWNTAFNEWFNDVKDNLLTAATLIRAYENVYYSAFVNQTIIPIGIPQYNRNLDTLMVYINGGLIARNRYEINSNAQITLTIPLPVVGTRVEFEIWKSIDGSQAETVVQEVGQLQTRMNAVDKQLEHHYYCNGSTDNVNISVLCRDFLTGGDDYGSLKLVIHGKIGVTVPYGGDGTSTNAYRWFDLGRGSSTNRRVFVDFTDCSPIDISCADDSANIIFYGLHVNVIGANVIATGGDYIYIFSTASNVVISAEHCRFWVTTNLFSYISKSGTFRNCRGSITVNNGNAYCFSVEAASLLRLEGGEYYAYTGLSTGVSAVVSVASTQTNAVAITYGINCPTVSRNPLRQTHAINCGTNSALCSFTDTITTLPINAEGQNIRGTIAISRAGMM